MTDVEAVASAPADPVPVLNASEKTALEADHDHESHGDEEDRDHDLTGSSESHNDDAETKSLAIDGGGAAWLVVLGAWCSSFCSYGWINSVGIFQEYYATGPLKDYSPSQIAWIPSLQIFFMSFLGPIMGVLFDRYGPRPLLIVGSFMHVFGLMMASISTEYYQFLLSQGVCSAMGVAAVFIAAVSCISGWFDKRRGLAFGVLATGSSLGGVVLPIMITSLINSAGYGWAMRTGAFVILAFLIVCILTVKRRTSRSLQPAKLDPKALGKPFRELVFVLLLIGLALVPFGLYTPITFLPTLAVRDGMATELAKYLVAIYNAGSLFGRLGSGILGDKYGRFNVFIISCYLSGILLIAMWIPGSGQSTTIAFTALFGFFSGAYIALVVALIAQISPQDQIGYRNGIASFVQSIGSLVTSPIAGAIIEKPNGVLGVKLYAGAFLLAGTTAILFARLVKTRWSIKTPL